MKYYLHCSRDRKGVWDVKWQGAPVHMLEALTAAVLSIAAENELDWKQMLGIVGAICQGKAETVRQEDKKESAPADGSSTGQKEGITDEL